MRKIGVIAVMVLALIGGALAQSGSAPALTWPLALGVGQGYRVRIQGVNTWVVALSAQSGTAYTGVAKPTDGGATLRAALFNRPDADSAELDLVSEAGAMYSCIFTGKPSLSANKLIGVTFYRASSAAQFTNLNTPCELIPSQTSQTQPVQPMPVQITPNPSRAPSLNWPPAFAVGQTWSVTFSVGTWVATMTQLDEEGDPVGVTSSGPNRRTAGVFMINADRATMYTYLKDVEVLRCVAVKSGLTGAVLTGRAERFAPPDTRNPAQDAGPCSFTLQNAAAQSNATPAQPTSAQPPLAQPTTAPALSFPPKISVSQTWNVQIGNTLNWVLTLSETDSDGPLGLARGTDNRVGYFVYSAKDASLALFLDTKTDRYGCLFDNTSLQGNSLRGNSFKAVGSAGFQPLNQPCVLTLQMQTISAQQMLGDWLEQRGIGDSFQH